MNAGTKIAVRLMDRIHRGRDGNLRRARQFTDLILMQGPEVKLAEDLIRATFGKMLYPPHTRDS